MEYDIHIRGTQPIIMHNGAAGLDTRSPANLEKAEIARKKGSNRTASDDERLRELECQISLWLDASGAPTIPAAAFRSMIERAARKLKQGPQVREGLIVLGDAEFEYDRERYGTTIEQLGKNTRFTTGVVVQRNRVLRTRAMFEEWEAHFRIEVDEELVDKEQLETWLDIGSRRIGLGDWRPEKSGRYGRFEVLAVEEIKC